jgi:hypothetical protein
MSWTFTDGIFALKLDFSRFRHKRVAPPAAKKKKKALGARPLPPPFPLPPVEKVDLLAAPALADAPPLPTPSVIVDDEALASSPAATLLMDEVDSDAVTRTSPLESEKTDLMQLRRDVRKALRSA